MARGKVAVSKTWAEQHPEAVTERTGKDGKTYYYREAASAGEMSEGESRGETRAETFTRLKEERSQEKQATPEAERDRSSITTSKGQQVTGVTGNVGWVSAKDEYGRSVKVYDPDAYSAYQGHSPGYYGFHERDESGDVRRAYGGKTGEEPILPSNYYNLPAREQYKVAKELGLIPLNAYYEAAEGGTWTYSTPEIRQARRERTAAMDTYAKAVSENQALMIALKPYKKRSFLSVWAPYTPLSERYVYDISGALRDGAVTVGQLKSAFPSTTVDKAVKYNQELSRILESTKKPDNLPSDDEYQKLSFKEKIALAKNGDLRAKWGVLTWDTAVERENMKQSGIMTKPLGEVSKDELFTLLSYGYENIAEAAGSLKAPKLTKYYQETPWADKLIQGMVRGAGDTLVSIATLPVVGGAVVSKADQPAAAAAIGAGVVVGTVAWGKDTVVNVWKDPASGIPYAYMTLLPMAIEPARAVTRMASKIYVYAHPKGMPLKGFSIEYSTGRIPVGELPKGELGQAVGKALKEAAKKGGASSGEVTVGSVTVKYLKTPFQQEIGNALWHGTGDINFVSKTGKLPAKSEGMYFNPYAAENYAVGSNPGFVLLLTDINKFRKVPLSILDKIGTSDKYIRQATEGLYQPSKLWRGEFETEIVASPGTEFKLPTSEAGLGQRILAGSAADYFTYNAKTGKFMPIRLALDKGVFPRKISTVDLYAMKLTVMADSLRYFSEAVKHPRRTILDIVKGRQGPKGVREMEVTKVDAEAIARMRGVSEALESQAKAKATQVSKGNKAKYAGEYSRELKRLYEEYGKRLIDEYGKELDRAYDTARGRARFESIYRLSLTRAARIYTRERMYTQSARETRSVVQSDIARRSGGRVASRGTTASRVTAREPEISIVNDRIDMNVGREDGRGSRDRRDDGTVPRNRRDDGTVPRDDGTVPYDGIDDGTVPRDDRDRSLNNDLKPTPEQLKGATTWPQGFGWWVVYKDAKGIARSTFVYGQKPPKGAKVVKQGPGEARRGIQRLGKGPENFNMPMGAVRVSVENPAPEPGRHGAIEFKHGNVRIVSTNDTEVTRTRTRKFGTPKRGNRGKTRKPRVIDLGAGIIKSRRGQHIRLG